MTTLDSFIGRLPSDIHIISGNQKTPSSLYLIFTQENFLKLLSHLPENQLIFRYLEKTSTNALLIHLAYLEGKLSLQLSIEVKNRSIDFRSNLCASFPAAEVYIDEF